MALVNVIVYSFFVSFFFNPSPFYFLNNFNKLFQKELNRTKMTNIFKGKNVVIGSFIRIHLNRILNIISVICQQLRPNFIFLEKKKNTFVLGTFAFVEFYSVVRDYRTGHCAIK